MQKQYAALVWTSRELEDKDLQMISSRKDMVSLSNDQIFILTCASETMYDTMAEHVMSFIFGTVQLSLEYLFPSCSFLLSLAS